MKPAKLTSQQRLFAYAYFNNKGNGTQAAIEAGYTKRSAAVHASRLLTNDNIKKLIEKLNQKVEEKAIITKEEVLKEYRRIALFDIRTIYDDNNALLPIADFSDEAAAAVAGIEVLQEFIGKIHIGDTIKVKLNNKIAALDAIRDTMGWSERQEKPTGDIVININGRKPNA